MLRTSPKSPFWGPKRENHPHQHHAPRNTGPMSSNPSSPPLEEPRHHFLVYSQIVVIGQPDGNFSPPRSGIINIAKDTGIDGLKTEIWDLIQSGKYTNGYIPWDGHVPSLDVKVKWVGGNVVPEAVLSTDNEVRTAIEFMADRGFRDHFSVICYLTTRYSQYPSHRVSPDDDDGSNSTVKADKQFQVDGGEIRWMKEEWQGEGGVIERW